MNAIEKVKQKTGQERWAALETWEREQMLLNVGYSRSFAKLAWSKLPYLTKDNLTRAFENPKKRS